MNWRARSALGALLVLAGALALWAFWPAGESDTADRLENGGERNETSVRELAQGDGLLDEKPDRPPDEDPGRPPDGEEGGSGAGGPPDLSHVRPPEQTEDGTVVAYLDVHVSLPDGGPASGTEVMLYLGHSKAERDELASTGMIHVSPGEADRIPEGRRVSVHAKLPATGQCYMPVQYFREVQAREFSLVFDVWEPDGCNSPSRPEWFYDDLWGRVVPVDVRLEAEPAQKGPTIAVVLENVDPDDLEKGLLEFWVNQAGGIRTVWGDLPSYESRVTKEAFEVRDLEPTIPVEIRIRDKTGRYLEHRQSFDPPFSEHLEIRLERSSDTGIVKIGCYEAFWTRVEFYSVETGKRVSPIGYLPPDDGAVFRIRAGEYGVFLYSAPVGEGKPTYDSARVVVLPEETVFAHLDKSAPGVSASLVVRGEDGNPIPEVKYDILSPLEGTDKFFRLEIHQRADRPREGHLEIHSLPPGGKLVFYAKDDPDRIVRERDRVELETLVLPAEPGARLEAEVVLPR